MSEERVCTYDPLIELMKRFENVRISDTGVDAFDGLTIEEQLKKHQEESGATFRSRA